MTELEESEEVARLIFGTCDTDNDGFIDRKDLDRLCQDLQLKNSENFQDILKEVGDGNRVNFQEFNHFKRNFEIRNDFHNKRIGEEIRKFIILRRRHNLNTSRFSVENWSWDQRNVEQEGQIPFEVDEIHRRPPPNLAQIADSIEHSAQISSLHQEIEKLRLKLQEVQIDRDHLSWKLVQQQQNVILESKSSVSSDNEVSSMTSQRYEERIVELHSVIAELTRKLDDHTDDVIKEEEEDLDEEFGRKSDDEDGYDNLVEISDSFNEEEDYKSENEYESLTEFKQRTVVGDADHGSNELNPQKRVQGSEQFPVRCRDYESEIFSLQQNILSLQSENEELKVLVEGKDRDLNDFSLKFEHLSQERDNYKRQLEDIKTTVEYQEAKMELFSNHNNKNSNSRKDVSSPSCQSQNSRSSSERRSLRRRRTAGSVAREATKSSAQAAAEVKNTDEINIELDQIRSRSEHLKSQNEVLALNLADSKSLTDRLTNMLNKYESNNTAMNLAASYCDQMIESYDILVALLETEYSVILATSSNSTSPSTVSTSNELKRALTNRKSAEKVAKHFLCKTSDKTLDSGTGSGHRKERKHFPRSASAAGVPISCLDHGIWEDSSGYSQTTSSTSTTSSCLDSSLDFTKTDELRLREHISSLKAIRSSIQSTVVEIEPLHSDPDIPRVREGSVFSTATSSTSTSYHQHQADLETAVVHQELMATKEEVADLRAKLYLYEKEKANTDLILSDRIALEEVLRAHVQHLQEELGMAERAEWGGTKGHLIRPDVSSREKELRSRVEHLIATLDRISHNSEVRHQQSHELIEDLKRANSTLTEALEKNKKKYQSKLRKMEQQLIARSTMTADKQQLKSASANLTPMKSSIPVFKGAK